MSAGGGRITNRAGRDRPRFIRPVERQRMRPWLEEHLDKNDIPGLNWVNIKERIFRIAWKHAANQCFNLQKDTNLFERWAIHTGRHYDSDHKRWKANFRCALNSLPDVKENKEQGIKKGNNAFKVYKFLDERETRGIRESKVKKNKDYEGEMAMKMTDDGDDVYDAVEDISVDDGEESASMQSIPKLDQLYPSSGVEMLLEAGTKEKVEPLTDTAEDTNLQEILAAATASVAAGSDPATLENISIDQLKRLGEVSRMRLDVRQSTKKSTSGYMYVFLCRWCEKVFPRKIELFQHFLITHQDKLLAGEEYGDQSTQNDPKHQKLLEEIEDLEQKVLGLHENTYTSSETESEDVHEDDKTCREAVTNESEEKALDLTMSHKGQKSSPKQETALDLSMSTGKRHRSTSKHTVKRRRSSQDSDVNYSIKFGNYGIAGTPRTKRQLSLHSRRMEEEQERLAKKLPNTDSPDTADTSRQHSVEDIVHAEMLLALKTGNEEGSEKGSSKSQTVKGGNNGKAGKRGKTTVKKSRKPVNTLQTDKKLIGKDSSVTEGEAYTKDRSGAKSNKAFAMRAFKCGLCLSKFTTSKSLLEHVKSHQGTFLHKCRNCGTQCDSQKDLIQHISSTHPNYPHRCDFCGKFCKTVKKLKNHMWSHIRVCQLCGEKFYNTDLFDIHLREIHDVRKGTETADQPEADSVELAALDIHNDVKMESDDSDENVDEEEREEDKDSNATTEFAEDSDEDPDNSDGVRVTDPTEDAAEGHGEDELNEDNGTGENDPRDQSSDGTGHNTDTVKDAQEDNSSKLENELEIKEEEVKFVDTAEKTGEENTSNDEIMMDTNTKVECREMDLVKDYAKNVKEKSDGIPVIKEGESVMLEETKHEVKLEKDLHERDECSDSGSKILGHGQPSAANVDNKFDPVEDMSDNISSPSQSSDKTQIIIKVSDTEKKMVYPESAVYKTKAKHLKRIMGTAYNGTCLVCNKTVPMNFIAKHIKSHSVITLIKAKEALDMLGIKIHALEHPLFVCNLCNMGFDSCSSLSTHVSKHVSQHLVPTTGNKPNPSHPREGIKKRKGDEAMHSDSKAKCSKTVQSKTVQSTSSVYVGKPHAANLPSSSNQTKGTGARTVNSAGSILAAYLNAGPMYQTSSLATIFKLTNDSSQVDMVSARDPTDVGPTGRDLNEHAVSNPNTFQHGAAQEKEIENMVAGAKQRAAFNPNPGAVLFPREGKEPAKPIPLMFIKGDSKQDLKLIPASSLTLPRGGQVLKVIPQGLLHDQPGTDLQGRAPGGGPDNSSTMVTTTYDQSVGAISSIGPTCPTLSISSPLTRNMTTQSTDDGQTIDQSSRSVYGVDKPVSVASQDIVSRLSGATEMKLAVSPNHNTPVSLSKSISNIGSGDTGSKESAGTTTIMSTLPASISHGQNLPVSLQPGHSLPVTLQPGQNLPVTLQPKQNLPISLQFGQNLPVTLQPRQNLPVSLQLGQNLPASLPSRHNVSTGLHSGQVQFVSPVGANQSSGRQLTILKCPLGVNVIRYSNSPSIAEQTQAPGAQLQLQQAHLSEETPKAMVSKTSIPRITFTESGTNTLPVDSVSAKQSSPAAVVSARTIPVAPQLSVVNDPATSTNIKLSQYLQNQGVVSTSGNDIVTSNMHSNAKTLPADQPHVKGTAKKPTFNLVITQSPLTHPALGSPAVISGSGLPLTLGRGSLHDSTLISSSTSTAGNTTTTTTNRLALICNLCTTEIQNLEMISRHVCTSRPSTTSLVVATGGTPVRESVIFPCVSCNREFNDLEILLLHQRCHNVADVTAPLFACQLCSKVYKTDVTYAAHMDTCHGNRVLSCPLCHRVFPDQTRCAEHIQTDHSAQTKCDLCPIGDTKLYVTSTDLHLHRMFEHPFECAHCDSRFNNVDQIWDHVSNHSIVKTSKKPPPPSTLQGHDQGGVICRKCLVGFVSLQTFQTHVRIQHPGDKFYTLMEENPAKCPLCECSYKHKKTLNHHVLNVHVRKVNYSCSVCGLVCVTPGHLASHLKEHWSQTQPAASEFEIVFCHPCQMVFPSRSLHTQHLQTNCEADKESKTNTVPTSDTTGSTIDKTFGNQPVLQLKMDKHEVMDGKPITISSTFGSIVSPDVTTASDAVVKGRDGAVSEYLCELCGMEGFKSKFLLKQHRVIRHLRPHPRASPSYYQHVIDNLKRPKSYDCIVCGKKFDASSVLKLHMKSHLRHIKPNFVCSFRGCRAKFTTRLSCLNHIKTCSFKNNRADQELDYYNGAREVADKSAVSCKTCFIMFNTRNGLKRHLVRKHPGEVTKCTYCGEMCSHATFDDHSQTCTGTN